MLVCVGVALGVCLILGPAGTGAREMGGERYEMREREIERKRERGRDRDTGREKNTEKNKLPPFLCTPLQQLPGHHKNTTNFLLKVSVKILSKVLLKVL